MRNFFGDIKDKILRANGADDDDDYYNDDDNYYDDDEEDTYEDEREDVSSSYSPSGEYDFGYLNDNDENRFTAPPRQPKPSQAPSSSKEKFTKKQGTNIYQMNNTPAQARVNRVVYFVIENAEDARNIADCMIKKDTVVLADISRLSVEDANRVLNFLDGVRYICKSSIEEIGDIHLIVPDTIEFTGDFFNQVNNGSFFG